MKTARNARVLWRSLIVSVLFIILSEFNLGIVATIILIFGLIAAYFSEEFE